MATLQTLEPSLSANHLTPSPWLPDSITEREKLVMCQGLAAFKYAAENGKRQWTETLPCCVVRYERTTLWRKE